ncbi:IclR family transcriptional regulator [Gulosibacter molinativorax]|uniref:ArsR family transcriptional regulator n=1 Tax=Gulosibacter molinativorax TaxID=256821 RepID=A0ABT7C675_9MICO|nr:helix-turn-helix domain-containing protein [Gulosibacter molinativorax]MDJ1370683.1 ArsR family transcriptional regulator [Gulosibacter molinativorax]QUY63290.1 Putative HTH-type transcriptional regulator RhmR [Gulosibacter molinativorax]
MAEAGSQTLSRGLRALELIGESTTPLSVPEVAEKLGIHRSMAYRLVRTLEDHALVVRNADGGLEVGVRMVSLARNAARDLRAAATPELTRLAQELGKTAFVATFDGAEVVTLVTVEPQQADSTVGQRPGSRHPIDSGAPGRVIRSQVNPEEFPAERYELSHDEVIGGLTSIAVPIRLTSGVPTSLAIVYLTQEIDIDSTVAELEASARRIERASH